MIASDWKHTACILCECNCGVEVELGGEGGRHLVRLRGDKRRPSYACEKRIGSTTTRTVSID